MWWCGVVVLVLSDYVCVWMVEVEVFCGSEVEWMVDFFDMICLCFVGIRIVFVGGFFNVYCVVSEGIVWGMDLVLVLGSIVCMFGGFKGFFKLDNMEVMIKCFVGVDCIGEVYGMIEVSLLFNVCVLGNFYILFWVILLVFDLVSGVL